MSGPIVDDSSSPKVGVPINMSVKETRATPGTPHWTSHLDRARHGSVLPSGSGCFGLSAATKLRVVDVITPHDVQPDQERSSDRDLGACLPATMQDTVVEMLEIRITPERRVPGLAKHEA